MVFSLLTFCFLFFLLYSVNASTVGKPIPEKVRVSSPLFQTMLQAGSVTISIKDSGAGLSKEQVEQISSEGVKFNENVLTAGQGSGLGLFISKGVVEQHGGSMKVSSEGIGRGVTISIELPLFRYDWQGKFNRDSSVSLVSAQSAGDDNDNKSNESGDHNPKILKDIDNNEVDKMPVEDTMDLNSSSYEVLYPPQRLLVVDDSLLNRKMMVRLLIGQGHTCEQAEDGLAALQKYTEMKRRGEAPNAILMDFEMPVMNGPAATGKLRDMGCRCLIVGVTGNVLPQDVVVFREKGADAVLPKPLAIENLNGLLATHRNKQKARKKTKKLSASTGSGASASSKVVPFEDIV